MGTTGEVACVIREKYRVDFKRISSPILLIREFQA